MPFDNADNKTATAITNESLENYIHMYMRPDRNFAEQWPESDGESQIGGRRDPLSTDYALITRLSNPGSTILPIRIVSTLTNMRTEYEFGLGILPLQHFSNTAYFRAPLRRDMSLAMRNPLVRFTTSTSYTEKLLFGTEESISNYLIYKMSTTCRTGFDI